jgi:LacI family transcriptional regulator
MSEATRNRIMEAARALSYVPSEAGRSLSTKATKRIGVVSAELTNPFFPQLIEPMREGLEKRGYRTLLITDRAENPLEIGLLADGSLDGVILTTATLGSSLPHELASRRIPFVLVNREIDSIAADTCVMDNRSGAEQVAQLLIRLGHRRVGAIFGPQETSTGRDREVGLRAGLSEVGVSLPRNLTRRGPFSYETGHRAMRELLDNPTPPAAVFCGNDVIALGAHSAAIGRGLRLPRDLTIVGFDDIAMASWESFGLTTVRCDFTAMAEAAVGMLLKRIKQPSLPHQRQVLSPRLVLRGTHGPPAS